MKLLPEDPRLTAYALGEIEDESERIDIEAAVNESPELQQAVTAIQDLGSMLGVSFAEESALELSEFDKAKLEVEPAAEILKGRFFTWPVLTSAAAMLLLAVVLVSQFTQKEETFTYQAPFREAGGDANASEKVTRYVPLEVSIPPELNEGMPQRVEVRKLEPVSSQASRMDMEVASVSDRVAVVAGEEQNAAGLLGADETAAAPVGGTRGDGRENAKINMTSPRSSPAMPALINADAKSAARSLQSERTRSSVLTVQQQLPVKSLIVARDLGLASGFIAEGEDSLLASQQPPREQDNAANTENYDEIEASDFRSPLVAPLSTFSIDVDTASYANVRRFLNQRQLPPVDAVRIEEMINYFGYDDAAPSQSLSEGGDPFAVHMAQTYAPWNTENRLLRIALKGYEMPWEERPASNLVFLLDVSGSMSQPNKLPLVKHAMDLLVRRLDKRDRVAIVVYAGASGLVLPSTTADNHETIAHAMKHLSAGGSTDAGAGIELAYETARKHFIENGNNRVILCTDGDFNVGQTNRGNLADRAEEQADTGISLTVLGFGMGNYKDGMLETLSNRGKGTYAYVDSQTEARKVFLEDLASTIFKIAKDVKIQVEFNPMQVQAYRLIGYENRRLNAEDFNNDAKKASDIGPGHSIVALYEIVPARGEITMPSVDALRYQQAAVVESTPGELATVKLRYKQPDGTVSQLIIRSVQSDEITAINQASVDLRFSAAVAAFGLRLSGSKHVGEYDFDSIEKLAVDSLGEDPGGHRSEFTELVRIARSLEVE